MGSQTNLRCQLVGMDSELMFVSLEYVEGYIEGKVNHEKELKFQVIDFVARHPTNLGIVCIVIIDIIIELGR